MNTPGSAGHGFHEWPLVVFTTLAIMGAGLLATPLFAWAIAGTPAPAAGALPWGSPAARRRPGRVAGAPRAAAARAARAARPRPQPPERRDRAVPAWRSAVGAAAAVLPLRLAGPRHRRGACVRRVPGDARPRLQPARAAHVARRGGGHAAEQRSRLRGGVAGRACGATRWWPSARSPRSRWPLDTGLLILRRAALVFPRSPLSPRYPAHLRAPPCPARRAARARRRPPRHLPPGWPAGRSPPASSLSASSSIASPSTASPASTRRRPKSLGSKSLLASS